MLFPEGLPSFQGGPAVPFGFACGGPAGLAEMTTCFRVLQMTRVELMMMDHKALCTPPVTLSDPQSPSQT